MAFSNQSTKLRLLKLLQHSLSTQPNTPVSLSELAQTLNVSRERVRQLYRKLAVEYALPPVRKRSPGISEINRHQANEALTKLTRSGDEVHKLRTPSPQTLALEAEVRKYIKQNMIVPEIARKIGRPAPTIYTVLQRLGLPFKRAKDTGRRLRNSSTLALEAKVRKYNEHGLSTPEIAKRTGRSESNIQRIHHRLHIPLPRRRKSRETQALEAEVSAYSEQGLTTAEIARKTGRPLRTIYHVLRRLHIPFNSALRRKSPETREIETEVRKYSEQGLTAPEIAGKIRRPRTTIYSVLSRLGIPFKGVKDTGLRNPKTRDFDAEVKWYYFSLVMSSKHIASITRKDMKTVYAALHRLGVPLKKQSRRSG